MNHPRITTSSQRPLGRLVLPLLGLLFFAGHCEAATIRRCIGEQGEPMFAEQCTNPAGTARVDSVERRRPSARNYSVAAAPARGSDFCARSPELLQRHVEAALRTRNGVRLSGYALWRGVSARAARYEARSLLSLLKAGSVGVSLRRAAEFEPVETDAPALVLMPLSQRNGAAESDQLWFRVVRDHGCWWLDPRPQRIEPQHEPEPEPQYVEAPAPSDEAIARGLW
ncbi:MAG TPA: hypothetical protein VLF18_03070 [Tahibacter sp.]|uniref:hypothetical protein n=1 Tax=Tahibacter sp. TaxID=2056211 RepID=UPI002BCF9892|nr:hypothetical protein [Tahibacter sp.]HSX59161.1 hypothetical protein [Tahibacter sp.]